jgi:hypothetical protein
MVVAAVQVVEQTMLGLEVLAEGGTLEILEALGTPQLHRQHKVILVAVQ